MSPRPLAAHLNRLIGFSLLPLLLMAVWLAVDRVRTDQLELEGAAQRRLNNYSARIDGFLEARMLALKLLAASPLADDPGRLTDLYAVAQAFREHLGSHLIFADATGQMLLNTRVPLGAVLPSNIIAGHDHVGKLVLSTGQPAVSNLFIGQLTQEPMLAIAVPGVRAGEVRHLMLAAYSVEQIRQQVAQIALQPGWALTLSDGNGKLIARQAPPGFDPERDVDPRWRFAQQLRFAPWTISVEIPRNVQQTPLIVFSLTLALGIVLATLGGMLGSARIARQINGQVASLADPAATDPASEEIAEIAAARRRIASAQAELRASEAGHRHLFEHNPAPMLVYARGSLRLLAVNEAFSSLYGYSQAEAHALLLTDLYPPHEKQAITDLVASLAGYAYAGEWHHIKKDGSQITIEARSHDIDYEGCPARMAVISDITARKAVEQAVRESEERFRNLAENSADWIWALDRNGRHTYSNPNIGAILGIAVDAFLVLDAATLVHPDDMELFGATFEQSRANRTGWRNVVIRWRHKDGSYRLLESSAAPVMDAQGELQGFQGVDRDITERVQAEQERERLASILEATTDIVSMADPLGNVIYLNGPGRSLLGIESNSTIPDVIPKVHPQWATNIILGEGLPTAIRAGNWSGETAVLGPDGEEIPVSQVILSHKDKQGNLLFLSTIMRDIRASRAAAQALRDSEERLRLALTAASQGLYDLDLITGDAQVSPEYATMLGYDPATFKETNAAWRERLHPDDQATVYKAFEDYVAGRLPEYRVEFRQRTRDGGWKWVLSLGRIQEWSPDGQPLRMLGTHTDIDAIKAAEAALRDLNTTLEARVAQRTAELSAANQELESFAYAVSHDLRAPLRAMSGFSLALQEDYGDMLTGDAKRYLDQIDLASRKMSELVDGLLTLSRSTRGGLRHDPVDLSALARRRLVRLARDEPQRQVTTDVEPGLHAIGDTRMLEVVIDNLIDNAWKYTGRTAAPRIRVHAGTVHGVRGFCVSDNGAGFDMAHAARLFQPFQRLHRQEEFPGTGIGLATVQRIVHRHGGEIVAQGKPGEGASFCFTLPAPDLEIPS